MTKKNVYLTCISPAIMGLAEQLSLTDVNDIPGELLSEHE